MKIGILGAAGTLGSCTAFAILQQQIAGELWLLDVNWNLLLSHSMDLQVAASQIGEMTVHVGAGDEDLAGCDLVVNTAGAPRREKPDRVNMLEDGVRLAASLAETIAQYCPEALVINATNPVDHFNTVFHQVSGIPRTQLLGYSLNDSYRVRTYVAQRLGVSAKRVEALVVGEHGPHQVPLWSTMKLDGVALDMTPEFREYVRAAIPAFLQKMESLGTGRTAGWISGQGMAEMTAAIARDTGKIFPCSVLLQGEYGRRGFSAGVPVRIGRKGLIEVLELPLPEDEKAEFDRALDILADTAQTASKLLSA